MAIYTMMPIMVYSSVGRVDNECSPNCGIGESAVLTGAVQRERKDEGMKDNGRNGGKYIAFLLVGICVCALAACGMGSLRKGNTPGDNTLEGQESGSEVEAESSEDTKEENVFKGENVSEEENAASEPEDSEDWEQELSVLVVLWDGESEDFENRVYGSREKFLEDFGFAVKEPFYEYVDTDQQPVLELYFDEEAEQGCGLYHDYRYIYGTGEVVKHYGFYFQHIITEKWTPEDTYSTLSAFGDDAKELELSQYQETCEYTDDGQLSSFEARGIIPGLGDDDIEDSVLSMNYSYRSDGTLAYKEYHHHPLAFGTWMQSVRSWYDPLERLVYRSSYITHGSVEYFYIYENDGDQPGYLLMLDEHGGYAVWPEMIRFR